MRAITRRVVGSAGPLIAAYWRSDERWRARALLTLIVGLDLLIVWRAARVTFWQRDLYDAFAAYDVAAFWDLMAQLMVLASIGVVMNTARIYAAQALEMRWRSWMTEVFVARWLSGMAFYRIEHDKQVDNVDQRIAEDMRMLATHTLSLGLGLLSNLVNLVTFSIILWGLSGVLTVALGSFNLEIPGYMLWASVLFAALGSVAMEKVGGAWLQLITGNNRPRRISACCWCASAKARSRLPFMLGRTPRRPAWGRALPRCAKTGAR